MHCRTVSDFSLSVRTKRLPNFSAKIEEEYNLRLCSFGAHPFCQDPINMSLIQFTASMPAGGIETF